jgi:hypothetical protein
LRRETALLLNLPGEEDLGLSRQEPTGVRCILQPGLPVALRGKLIDDSHWLAVAVAPYRNTLDWLRYSSANIRRELVPALLKDPRGSSVLNGREVHLDAVFSLSEDLLKEVQKFNLTKWILEVDQDVLGRYVYRVPKDLFGDLHEAHIELYWAVIGLLVRLLGTSAEALTAVVFAHELTHAFTHMGSDTDRNRWPTRDFAKADHAVKEGLAQYYTALVCSQLDRQQPGTSGAYAALLADQPPAYHTHERWLEDHKPEEVRDAIIQARRRGLGTLADFAKLLGEARERFRKAADSQNAQKRG